jgi:glycosyltransferase 2 family protein
MFESVEKISWRRILGYIVAFAALGSLGIVLMRSWDDVVKSGFKFEFDVPPLIVSLVLLIVARGFAVEAWRRILISLGEHFSFGFGARVWFLSNLTRYIPGNVWQVATMMVMVEQRGVSKTNALLSQVLYTALALAIAGLVGLMFIFTRPDLFAAILPASIASFAPVIAALAFVALVIVFALPITHRRIVAITARLMHRDIMAPAPTFVRGLVPPLFSWMMWLTNGVAFYLFIASITPLALGNIFAFIAMNAAAYWIGYVSFLTPSGLGVREGMLALMLSTFFPMPIAVALSLVTRLWTTAGELLGASLILMSQRERGK